MGSASSSSRLSATRRKGLGAFYTPPQLTDFAAAWAVQDRDAVVLDPGCGDAAFLVSGARRLIRLGAQQVRVGRQVVGVDLNDDALATARAELSAAGVKDPVLVAADFFRLGTDLFAQTIPKADVLLGNPPYVRYQLFRDEQREAGLRAAARAGVILPALSSSWAPYVVHASTFLKEGGRLALVLPGEILHVGYAAAVREYLLRSFRELTIVTFEEKVFPGAMEEVVLILGTKGPGDGKLRVRRLNSLEDLAPGPNAVLARARVCEVEKGRRWLTALIEEGAVEVARQTIAEAKYAALGTHGRVDIGVVTGANQYFILDKSSVVESRLPVSALVPTISKAAHVQGARFTLQDWARLLEAGDPAYMLVVEGEPNGQPLARYIEKGEKLGIHQRYKCRVRTPWYRVPYVRRPDAFLTYMSHVAPRLVVNELRAAHSNTVHGVFLSDPLLAEPLAAAFLNSATLLSAEIEGRSYGGGVLKIEPGEAVRVLVPPLTKKLCQSLSDALPKLDELVRAQRLEEASAMVDGIVLGKRFSRAQIEQIRSVLASLRARRFARGRTS